MNICFVLLKLNLNPVSKSQLTWKIVIKVSEKCLTSRVASSSKILSVTLKLCSHRPLEITYVTLQLASYQHSIRKIQEKRCKVGVRQVLLCRVSVISFISINFTRLLNYILRLCSCLFIDCELIIEVSDSLLQRVRNE